MTGNRSDSAKVTAEIGQLALVLAFVLAILQSLVPLIGAARLDPALMGLGRAAALLQLLFVAIAFASLAAGFVGMDYSIAPGRPAQQPGTTDNLSVRRDLGQP